MVDRIGKFRHRVEIQTYTNSVDEEGGNNRSWATAATVWAKVNPISGKEREEGRQTESKLSHRITMRKYEAGLTAEDRIKFDGKFYNIIAIVDPEYRGCFEVIDVEMDEKQTA